jgi:hypothetical protein
MPKPPLIETYAIVGKVYSPTAKSNRVRIANGDNNIRIVVTEPLPSQQWSQSRVRFRDPSTGRLMMQTSASLPTIEIVEQSSNCGSRSSTRDDAIVAEWMRGHTSPSNSTRYSQSSIVNDTRVSFRFQLIFLTVRI